MRALGPRPLERGGEVGRAREQQRRDVGQVGRQVGDADRRRRPGEALLRDAVPACGGAVVRAGVDARRGPPQLRGAAGERRRGVAPRGRDVGAQRARVQALAERRRGEGADGGGGRGHDPVERGGVAARRRRERAPDAAEARRPDRVRGDRVEQLRAVAVARDDRAQVARRPGAEDARGRPHRHLPRHRQPGVRDDRVEHEPVDAAGVRERVALGDVGPVGGAVQRDPLGAERLPQQLEVGHGVGRGEEAPLGPEPRAARPHGARAGRRQVRGAHLALERGAAERAGAGPALVDRDDPPAGRAGRAQPRARPGQRGATGLARAAREVDQHRPVGRAGQRDRQVEAAARRARVVERHPQGRAARAGHVRARRGARQPRRGRGLRLPRRRRRGRRRPRGGLAVAAAAAGHHEHPEQEQRAPHRRDAPPSGGGGIRTLGTGGPGSTVFKTVAFNRSATPPGRRRECRAQPGAPPTRRWRPGRPGRRRPCPRGRSSRPGACRGTAGGRPRRSRTGPPGRSRS